MKNENVFLGASFIFDVFKCCMEALLRRVDVFIAKIWGNSSFVITFSSEGASRHPGWGYFVFFFVNPKLGFT